MKKKTKNRREKGRNPCGQKVMEERGILNHKCAHGEGEEKFFLYIDKNKSTRSILGENRVSRR